MGIASRIKAELGSSLAAILDAKTLADSVRSQREVNQFCEQLDVAMVADHERSLNRKRESKQATSAAKTAKILSIIGLAAATASIFLPYLLDGSKPQQQTNSAELKLDISNLGEKIADLELRHARSTVQISELSGHSHVNADSKFAKQIKDLEQRVLLYEKALTKGRQEIFAESIEVELRSNSRMPKQGNVVSLTASDSEGSYLLRERSLDSVLACWIEPLDGLDRTKFSVLETSGSKGNDLLLKYKLLEADTYVKARIRIHFIIQRHESFQDRQ